MSSYCCFCRLLFSEWNNLIQKEIPEIPAAAHDSCEKADRSLSSSLRPYQSVRNDAQLCFWGWMGAAYITGK